MAIPLLFLGMSALAATSLNLTTAGAYGQIGSALFSANTGKAGTGTLQPFYRLSQQGNNTTAEGYNASARPVMGDVNTSPTFTKDLLAGGLTTVFTNGIAYYQFWLDINQNNNDPLLSLDTVEVWLSSSPISPANTLAALASQATKVFDLDSVANGGSGNEILLNYDLNPGSGYADMIMLLPKSLFPNPAQYLTLVSKFGFKGGDYEENDGFEEWSTYSSGSYVSVGDRVWSTRVRLKRLGGLVSRCKCGGYNEGEV